VEFSGNSIEAAIHFMGDLAPDQVVSLVQTRLEKFNELLVQLNGEESDRAEQIIRRNKEHKPANLTPEEQQNWEQAQKLIPFLVDTSDNHQRYLIKGEIYWMEEFLADLRTKFGMNENNHA